MTAREFVPLYSSRAVSFIVRGVIIQSRFNSTMRNFFTRIIAINVVTADTAAMQARELSAVWMLQLGTSSPR